MIYHGGDILTMEAEWGNTSPEAVLVEDSLIHFVGDLAGARALAPDAELRDLKGGCLLPGFIDPHSHITALGQTMNLAALSDCGSIDEIVSRLSEHAKRHTHSKEEWVIGFSYDNNSIPGHVHPTREDLDRVSREQPVLISHVSGHMGVVNSRALELLGIDASTPDPEGGRIGRRKDCMEPNGFLEENAFIQMTSSTPKPGMEQLLRQLDEAQNLYLSYGITTAQDGMTNGAELSLLTAFAEQGRLLLDVVGYIDYFRSAHLLAEHSGLVESYQNHLRLGGYKIFLDGSPQGRTAWMSQPYEGAEDGYCGYPVRTDTEVEEAIRAAQRDGVQLLAHCNGDAAAEQYITAYGRFRDGQDLRPVIIHAQLLRRDQLPRVKEYGMIPSFFVAHTYYWGDIHLENFGAGRANFISPLRSAQQLGIPFTLHQDTPVIRPNMLETVWCAVNRQTRSGRQLGPEECITPYEALKAVTINAAYQYHEEKRKGSLRAGKLADFAILDRSPLKTAPEEIREIRVLETIKEGKSVYRA